MTEQVLWSDIDRWNYNDTKLLEFGISVTKEMLTRQVKFKQLQET